MSAPYFVKKGYTWEASPVDPSIAAQIPGLQMYGVCAKGPRDAMASLLTTW